MRKLFSAVILTVAAFTATTAFAQQTTAPNSGIGSGSSYNWAGYVAQGTGFSGVNGSWIVPSISNLAAASADATWIGIGGVGTSDLIQTGTQAVVDGSGTVQYTAWYETLPSFSHTVALTIHAGDYMTASIAQNSGNWDINLIDNTTGQNFHTTVAYNSSMSSAEWIEEMPSVGRGRFLGLDNFGSINFTGAGAIQNGQQENLQQLNAQGMTMLNGSQQPLATVSAINSDGASFAITRTSAASTSAATGFAVGRSFRRGGYGISGFSGFGRGRGGRRGLSFGGRGFYLVIR